MVLLYLKTTSVITTKEYQFFHQSLVMGVDAHDNGKDPEIPGLCTYSNIVSNFTPIPHDADESQQNAAFFEALAFACGHLTRLWERYNFIQSCRQIVADSMAQGNEYLLFDKGIPWMEIFFDMGGASHPAKFVIMPSGRHWKLRGIPPSLDDKMKVRYPLPKEWAGLLDEELKRISKIPGAIFCHKGRFISVWETKEDAIKALNYTLQSAKKNA
jgi:uncharacterized UPF0160 family protein